MKRLDRQQFEDMAFCVVIVAVMMAIIYSCCGCAAVKYVGGLVVRDVVTQEVVEQGPEIVKGVVGAAVLKYLPWVGSVLAALLGGGGTLRYFLKHREEKKKNTGAIVDAIRKNTGAHMQ